MEFPWLDVSMVIGVIVITAIVTAKIADRG